MRMNTGMEGTMAMAEVAAEVADLVGRVIRKGRREERHVR